VSRSIAFVTLTIAITITSILLPYLPNFGRGMAILPGKNDGFGVGVAIFG
jgi:hypothetical protein